jgi:hypothetical protein
MSISAMKQALEALESWQKTCLDCGRGSEELGRATKPIAALRQDIAEAEKQEPVAWREVAGKTTHYYDYNEQGRGEPLYLSPKVHETSMREPA